jgi:hypothetical protein
VRTQEPFSRCELLPVNATLLAVRVTHSSSKSKALILIGNCLDCSIQCKPLEAYQLSGVIFPGPEISVNASHTNVTQTENRDCPIVLTKPQKIYMPLTQPILRSSNFCLRVCAAVRFKPIFAHALRESAAVRWFSADIGQPPRTDPKPIDTRSHE